MGTINLCFVMGFQNNCYCYFFFAIESGRQLLLSFETLRGFSLAGKGALGLTNGARAGSSRDPRLSCPARPRFWHRHWHRFATWTCPHGAARAVSWTLSCYPCTICCHRLSVMPAAPLPCVAANTACDLTQPASEPAFWGAGARRERVAVAKGQQEGLPLPLAVMPGAGRGSPVRPGGRRTGAVCLGW